MGDRPTILDLFCCAGGAAMGYHRAGFDVVGVDCKPQPRYPFPFCEGDAIKLLDCLLRGGYFRAGEDGSPLYLENFAAIHASPPCQHYCAVNRTGKLKGKTYPDLVGPTRELLRQIGKPFVIENVVGAPLYFPALVCGSAFGLAVRRHRLFEGSMLLFGTVCRHAEQDRQGPRFPSCFRSKRALREQRPHRSTVVQVYGNTAGKALWPAAMGIDWMATRELSQAIPPVFTEFIGRQLLNVLG